jgi:hypothetical protein
MKIIFYGQYAPAFRALLECPDLSPFASGANDSAYALIPQVAQTLANILGERIEYRLQMTPHAALPLESADAVNAVKLLQQMQLGIAIPVPTQVPFRD